MPPPTHERHALERERVELPGQIIAHQAKLAATPAENKAPRVSGGGTRLATRP
jgi:hypothetical protein